MAKAIRGPWPKNDGDRKRRLNNLPTLSNTVLGHICHQTSVHIDYMETARNSSQLDQRVLDDLDELLERERRNMLAIASEINRRFER